jgi:hypothetical protein
MKTKVISLKDHIYNSGPKFKGEIYEIDDLALKYLALIGAVKVTDQSIPVDVTASEIDNKPYRRRDMRAGR